MDTDQNQVEFNRGDMTFTLTRKRGITNVPEKYELTDNQKLGIQLNQFPDSSPTIVAAPYIITDNDSVSLMVTNVNSTHIYDGTKTVPTTFEYTDASSNKYTGTVKFYFIQTWQ